eukprot:GEMP01072384.1.p2 GENE.GEMP01072384.1~~GEMP01072384.1.p2  ORF type:complete len:144 (+),score=28.30 GEMP01072384.1:38-433(+)
MAKAMKSAMKSGAKKAGTKKSGAKKSGAQKAAKKSTKRVSKIARGKRAKSSVFRGTKEKTSGGLQKKDLCRNKFGKIVSKKSSERAKKSKFMMAVQKARKALGIKGFQAVGGKTAKGQALLKKARSLYSKK